IVDLAAFSGMEMENMTRGHGWRFLDFGRRLERATHLVSVVRASLRSELTLHFILEPVLEIADSLMTYRRRYFAGVQLHAVLELILIDETNPRSLAFQLLALSQHLANLPGTVHALTGGDEQTRITGLIAHLCGSDIRR